MQQQVIVLVELVESYLAGPSISSLFSLRTKRVKSWSNNQFAVFNDTETMTQHALFGIKSPLRLSLPVNHRAFVYFASFRPVSEITDLLG
jgi:hypothetical protein